MRPLPVWTKSFIDRWKICLHYSKFSEASLVIQDVHCPMTFVLQGLAGGWLVTEHWLPTRKQWATKWSRRPFHWYHVTSDHCPLTCSPSSCFTQGTIIVYELFSSWSLAQTLFSKKRDWLSHSLWTEFTQRTTRLDYWIVMIVISIKTHAHFFFALTKIPQIQAVILEK